MIALANFNCLSIAAWVLGLLIAIGRRKEHPQVSAAMVWSVTCMFVAGCWSTYLRVDSLPTPTALALAGLANLLLFSLGWGALLAAVLGWRQSPGTPMHPSARLQFSIRSLLLFTLFVAVLCGLFRLVLWALELPPKFVLLLIGDVPFLLFWMVGAWQVWERRHELPKACRALAWGIGIQAGSIFALAVLAGATRINPRPIDDSVGSLFYLLALFAYFVAFPLSWGFFVAAAFASRDQRQPRSESTAAAKSALPSDVA